MARLSLAGHPRGSVRVAQDSRDDLEAELPGLGAIVTGASADRSETQIVVAGDMTDLNSHVQPVRLTAVISSLQMGGAERTMTLLPEPRSSGAGTWCCSAWRARPMRPSSSSIDASTSITWTSFVRRMVSRRANEQFSPS